MKNKLKQIFTKNFIKREVPEKNFSGTYLINLFELLDDNTFRKNVQQD
ncbi:hypothetical protein IJ818_04830 [bacterium]|nr:hypothetical protein [bacterium]